MIITKITASASAGFNHPYEQFANFKPSVTLEANLGVLPAAAGQTQLEYEDATAALERLQRYAQAAVDAERARIEAKLKREHELRHARRSFDFANTQLKQAEKSIAELTADSKVVAAVPGDEWEKQEMVRRLDEATASLPTLQAEFDKAKAVLDALDPDFQVQES